MLTSFSGSYISYLNDAVYDWKVGWEDGGGGLLVMTYSKGK